MFGTFRLVLATLVVITHAGVALGGFRLGPTSVVGFYIISGYVISFLLDKRVTRDLGRTFYAERFLRIYPEFLFHLVLALAFILATGYVSRFSDVPIGLTSIAINLTLLPLQARVFSEYLSGMLYVPTSWSLSLEASFYVIAPFLLRSRFMALFGWISFGLFALSVLTILPVPPHTISYATILGTLHFFVLGAWLQRGKRAQVGAWVVAMLVVAGLVTTTASWRPSHIQEVFVGGLGGLAAVAALAGIRPGRFRRIDDYLGRISYPVFLNHFLLIWLWEYFGWPTDAPAPLAGLVVASWALGAVAYLVVERPTDAFRRSLRRTAE